MGVEGPRRGEGWGGRGGGAWGGGRGGGVGGGGAAVLSHQRIWGIKSKSNSISDNYVL